MTLILFIILLVILFDSYLFQYAKQILTNQKQDFIFFKQQNYENKERYRQTLARGIRLLAIYIANSSFVVIMCILSHNIGYYLFAGLFLLTTISIWYVNMIQMLELSKKNNID